jgi:hypothetical protein
MSSSLMPVNYCSALAGPKSLTGMLDGGKYKALWFLTLPVLMLMGKWLYKHKFYSYS